jgi:hypothetical protein
VEKVKRSWQGFLDLLKQEEHTFHPSGATSLQLEDGIEATTEVGFIPRVCEAAADYCEKRIPEDESRERFRRSMEKATDRFYGVSSTHIVAPVLGSYRSGWRRLDVETPASTAPQQQEPTCIQLSKLREESRLTVEQLAERVKLDTRSVERHLAGKTIPRLAHIGCYEKIFSELLARHVVISKTPGKRR